MNITQRHETDTSVMIVIYEKVEEKEKKGGFVWYKLHSSSGHMFRNG